MAYTTTSGSAEIQSATGSGSYRANNSGEFRVGYTEVTGDLSFFNKNGAVYLTLPVDLEFEFEATTKNGVVSTFFDGLMKTDGRTIYAAVGSDPMATIRVETKNGDIEVTQ